MEFYEALDQVVNLLRARRRVTYCALKRQLFIVAYYAVGLTGFCQGELSVAYDYLQQANALRAT